ncbi:MAG: hypothetical protein A4E37_00463 [Methanoregulaceae archaeon PtaB.Bin056]|jgi:hypothetical protein|nr:MAG: hypothetical protein A4E37_00463 [Methanoregulaceae archaeon PtaB.Bin056]
MHLRIGYEEREEGVSPVVGVMLMLIVTIIIAAVVSGYAGNLVGNTPKAPTIAMDVKIANTGTWVGSGFYATVTGVSDPIPTEDLKIETTWMKRASDGTVIAGGGFVTGQLLINPYYGQIYGTYNPPIGFGSGVDETYPQKLTEPYSPNQHFGNYTLVQGTGLAAIPAGVDTSDPDAINGVSGGSAAEGYGVTSLFNYTASYVTSDPLTGLTDPAQTILGKRWNELRPGDSVSVSLIHVPTAKVLLQKEVMVTG